MRIVVVQRSTHARDVLHASEPTPSTSTARLNGTASCRRRNAASAPRSARDHFW